MDYWLPAVDWAGRGYAAVGVTVLLSFLIGLFS